MSDRKLRGIGDSELGNVWYQDSTKLLGRKDALGMLTLESAVQAVYLMVIRVSIRANATLYRRRIAALKVQVRDFIAAKALDKAAKTAAKTAVVKKALGTILKRITALWDLWKSATGDQELERALRQGGLITMLDLTAARLTPNRSTQTEWVYQRKKRLRVFIPMPYGGGVYVALLPGETPESVGPKKLLKRAIDQGKQQQKKDEATKRKIDQGGRSARAKAVMAEIEKGRK